MVSHSLRRRLGGVAAVAVLLGTFAVVTPAQATSGGNDVRKLTRSVTLAGLLRHLVALQAIATLNGGNRASGGPGYDRSADYVATLMRHAGYTVTRQPFQFNFCEDTGSSFAQNSPTPTTYADQTDYDVLDCSGNGTATGLVVPVDLALTTPNASSSGCEATDFTPAVAGNIALLQRGTCPFGQKVANAEAAGAIGAIMMNQGNSTAPDRQNLFFGTLGNPVGIPAISVSYPMGVAFAGTPNLNVTITTQTIAEVRDTENVFAESRWGDPDEVVMVGAHLDSEPDTAGINDNGTGSAGILEVALQMRKMKTKNKVRFAWWGAEESNLAGSTFYVNNLTDEQRAAIALYLNFDMIGSPNYTFGVYDGDDSAGQGSGPGPAGSAQIEAVFQAFFAARGEATAAADFTGRSDYGPFIATGIPAGGLFTGAEVQKTEADVALWGGVAGAQYDPCYHAPCDSLTPERNGADAALYRQLRREYRLFGNVNTFAFDTNADAVATAVATFANDTSTIPPRPAALSGTRSAAARGAAAGSLTE
ncbi:aminopeptidase [Phytohabitans aurantiacus]|uniref:Aminopeptidase n=1 Tax=Phytohabitans aurantiacus TaxID=3016789 RepID=A0ABQ5RCL3_9ACTN|nr:aminopeptidase [Phytohabitans aurantiacus]